MAPFRHASFPLNLLVLFRTHVSAACLRRAILPVQGIQLVKGAGERALVVGVVGAKKGRPEGRPGIFQSCRDVIDRPKAGTTPDQKLPYCSLPTKPSFVTPARLISASA